MINHVFQITLSDNDDYEVIVDMKKNGKITGFKVFDWQGEEKTQFSAKDSFILKREIYNRQYYESIND